MNSPRSTLSAFNLIQAIARVNRLHEEKQYGLLIDYRGILRELDTAIKEYQDLEQRTQGGFDLDDLEGLYANVDTEYKRLPTLHNQLWAIFAGVVNRGDIEQYRQILVRVRFGGSITLAVAGTRVDEELPFYALPDEQVPTLVIGQGMAITWPVLADAAPHLSTLLDRRMRSFETLLLRLAAHGASLEPKQRPSDEALARALGCRVELVREHTLALRTDSNLLFARLIPVVACLTDLETALVLRGELESTVTRSKVLDALVKLEPQLSIQPTALMSALANPDLAEVRRTLGLDYARMNQVLEALGLPVLSNEAELRRLFETWKSDLTPEVVNRLRRHYWSEYESGGTLDRYVLLRQLDFFEFQSGWVLDREHLDRQDVSNLIHQQLDALIGPDVPQELEPLKIIRSRNQRVLQRFLDESAPVIGAWCFRNGQTNPWSEGSLSILKLIDSKGLFDFAPIASGGEIAVLIRSGCWPDGMPQTVDLKALELNPEDLLGEKKRKQDHKEEIEVNRRTIYFADVTLDTGAEDFAQKLVEIADAQMVDGDWLLRSRKKLNLAEQGIQNPGSGGPGGKSGRRARPERIAEDIRRAMGFASEYLASRYLRDKHKERYDDQCWISENRAKLMTDWDGDDNRGYDFKVQTVEVEWRYEVKSSLNDSFEFEFTHNEMKVAAECASDGSKRYRILYVPFVFDPCRWRVMELPNPMSERGRKLFRAIGAGSTRYKFEPR